MLHALELNKMGAQITVESDYAKVRGVDHLVGASVYAHDIRAAAALILAGLVAHGTTKVFGLNHLLRGYYNLDKKLISLGAHIAFVDEQKITEEIVPKKIEIGFLEQAM
jgi:UDP-N-acetylglucosamine 1-carboxyvinyltransferase